MSDMARLFARGRPDPGEFATEGLLHLEEAGGTLTYRHYRAAGVRRSFEKELVHWTLVVTRQRLLVRSRKGPVVNVPWRDPRIGAVEVAVDEDKLLVRVDAGAFSPRRTGVVEVRVRCSDPARVLAAIEGLRAGR
jgi:hypothetical protein